MENFSPLAEDDVTLLEGDVAKITAGVQLDGQVIMGTHTVLVGAGMATTGPVAAAVCAAHYAAEAVTRLLRPGTLVRCRRMETNKKRKRRALASPSHPPFRFFVLDLCPGFVEPGHYADY